MEREEESDIGGRERRWNVLEEVEWNDKREGEKKAAASGRE